MLTLDDRDPPWINKNIKLLILRKNQAYKNQDLQTTKSLQFYSLTNFSFFKQSLTPN